MARPIDPGGHATGTPGIPRDNTITGGISGITVQPDARPTIEDNRLTAMRAGVSSFMADPIIRGNTIRDGEGVGIALTQGAPILDDNVVESMNMGLLVMAETLPALEGNTFCGNVDNVKWVRGGEDQTVTELPGNEVCPDGPRPSGG
jgi:nitrous oxidase accessory protein NosD